MANKPLHVFSTAKLRIFSVITENLRRESCKNPAKKSEFRRLKQRGREAYLRQRSIRPLGKSEIRYNGSAMCALAAVAVGCHVGIVAVFHTEQPEATLRGVRPTPASGPLTYRASYLVVGESRKAPLFINDPLAQAPEAHRRGGQAPWRAAHTDAGCSNRVGSYRVACRIKGLDSQHAGLIRYVPCN